MPIKPPKISCSRVTCSNWHIMVDTYSGVKVLAFFSWENYITETMCERLKKAKNNGTPVKYLWQDNARDNLKIQLRCKSTDWKLTVDFEYTPKKHAATNLDA